METHAPAMELGENVFVADLTLPPDIDEYVPLQEYAALGNSQLNGSKGSMADRQDAQALSGHSRVSMVVCMQQC